MEPKGDIALIGLAVMGQNLILNMNDHGFTVVAYNRTVVQGGRVPRQGSQGHEGARRPFHRGDGQAAQDARAAS